MKTRPIDNPFNMQRLEAIEYEPQGTTWPDIMQRLEELKYRAAIMGPHGSGKTTLMEELAIRLDDQGLRTISIRLNRNALYQSLTPLEQFTSDTIIMLDGAGCLSWLQRIKIMRRCHSCKGLLLTAHKRSRLPVLIRTSPSIEVLAKIVNDLDQDAARWPKPLLSEILTKCGGNMREALRELYDRHASHDPQIMTEA